MAAALPPPGGQVFVFQPEDRVLVELWAEAEPRIVRERLILESVTPTVYVVSDMDEVIGILDFTHDVARLYTFPKPGAGRVIPAWPTCADRPRSWRPSPPDSSRSVSGRAASEPSASDRQADCRTGGAMPIPQDFDYLPMTTVQCPRCGLDKDMPLVAHHTAA